MVESGDSGAQAAMDLHENPTKFLSTVQIGITSIGVLNGIVGEGAFAEPFAVWLVQAFAFNPEMARFGATALVVVVITVLTIIFGELVPKRLGQMYPEAVARLVATPMNWLSTATRPLVAGRHRRGDRGAARGGSGRGRHRGARASDGAQCVPAR
jgi:putative hemolysin